MNYPKTIVIGAALIAGAIFFSTGKGRYQIAGGNTGAWLVDIKTGLVAFCTPVPLFPTEGEELEKSLEVQCTEFY